MEDSKNRYRKVQKILRLTDRENDILSKRIKKSGYETFQAFAYQMLFDGEIYFQDFSELNDLHYEISKLGNNVNQLAKAANIYKQVSPDDVQELTDEIERLSNLLEEKLNHLTKKRRE
ncbi:MobC family plasmid mobilization relaxosome protein [Fructobacillus tropaeoli]|uniref:Mobilization protein PcfF n=1 Tax=Fructobacillus tropaeoli TaxID=709323 RepID=A0A3F3H2N9_9LACO|nr:MobC family plasmid mobilization relaxosome protein [Fructobacillus tropaeoli]GAP04814.1 mobilization protein PcfF [Fructobacillus tropaeoli]